jgi:hypothetical protein
MVVSFIPLYSSSIKIIIAEQKKKEKNDPEEVD